MTGEEMANGLEVVGVIPAGGEASRIAPLPCSKEIFPIGFRPWGGEGSTDFRPKVACHYLLESMRAAGAKKVYWVLRKGKWDIPEYLGNGNNLGLDLAYLILSLPYGAPYTVDQAFPFVQDALVLLGFPDILFEPQEAYVRLIEKQRASQADVVLGLFETRQPEKADMVIADSAGRVQQIVIKEADTGLQYAWVNAVWTPRFTHFMHVYLQRAMEAVAGLRAEYYVGNVIQAALEEGLRVESVAFPEGTFIDIGTPENLRAAIKRYVQ